MAALASVESGRGRGDESRDEGWSLLFIRPIFPLSLVRSPDGVRNPRKERVAYGGWGISKVGRWRRRCCRCGGGEWKRRRDRWAHAKDGRIQEWSWGLGVWTRRGLAPTLRPRLDWAEWLSSHVPLEVGALEGRERRSLCGSRTSLLLGRSGGPGDERRRGRGGGGGCRRRRRRPRLSLLVPEILGDCVEGGRRHGPVFLLPPTL